MIQYSFLSRSIEKILHNLRSMLSQKSMTMTIMIMIMHMMISMKSIIITTRSMQIMRGHVRQQHRYTQLNYTKKNTTIHTIIMITMKSIMKRQKMMNIMNKFITWNIKIKRSILMETIIMKIPIIKMIIMLIMRNLKTMIIMKKYLLAIMIYTYKKLLIPASLATVPKKTKNLNSHPALMIMTRFVYNRRQQQHSPNNSNVPKKSYRKRQRSKDNWSMKPKNRSDLESRPNCIITLNRRD